MKSIKQNFGYVLKSIEKDKTLTKKLSKLKGKTFIISGASRGIGLNIAEKLVKSEANVVITGKTVKPNPKLEGTLFTAEKYLKSFCKENKVLSVVCDVRSNNDINNAVHETINKFGSIDGVVLNASALCLKDTFSVTKKEIDLMNEININGTFLFGQKCIQYMKYGKNKNGHILVISPPINMLYNDNWWKNHLYYSMSKFNMSLMAKFWNSEFDNIGVNTLWPRTTINTAPVRNILGGEDMISISRTVDIMGDAANHILASDPKKCNGKNFIDDEVLLSVGIDVEQYRVDPEKNEKDLMPDFFC